MLLALLAAAVVAPADEPVARVDGTFIGAKEVAAELEAARQRGAGGTPEAALEALIAEALLADEGERLGLGRDPAVAAEVCWMLMRGR